MGILSRLVYAWTTFLVACKIPWNTHGTSRMWNFICEEHGIIRERVKCHGTCVAYHECDIVHKWDAELAIRVCYLIAIT